MSTTVEFECWAWISKRGDDCDSVTFEAKKFKKRKKRWISVTENRLVYSKTAKKSDMKYIPLEHSTAIKTFNESNLETMVWVIDSQTRAIQTVLEPDNFSRDVPLLVSALLRACSRQRRDITQQAIIANDIVGLKTILAYHTLAEAVLQDTNFSPFGTPLHFVVQNPKCLPCLPLLVDRGALVDSPNAEGLLPVHTAVQAGHLTVVQRMVEVAAWSLEQGGGALSSDVLVNLRTTIPSSHLENKLVEKSSDHLVKSHVVDRTPLHLSSDEEMTALLLRHGARLEDQDSEGNTPFLLACSRGLCLHATELLDSGAVVNQANWSTGLTPIMLVISNCNNSTFEGEQKRDAQSEEDLHTLFSDMLDRNADCSVTDNKQMSALHYSCRQGDLAICSTLLRAGAELDAQNSSGATPLCLAASVQSAAAGTSSFELCGLLMSKGSYPRIRDHQGRQALHYAAGAGNAETLSLLLDVSRGQDVNIVCFSGRTALDYTHETLNWLQSEDKGKERLSYFDDFNLVFPNCSEESLRNLKQRYMNCEAVLKKFGALERTNAHIPVEQHCRDMAFSSSKNGTYVVASATPYAALVRLTSFLFYSKSNADLFLLSYKSFISPLELLKLFKIRFYILNNLPEKAVVLSDNSAFSLGLTFEDIELIILQFRVIEDMGKSGRGSDDNRDRKSPHVQEGPDKNSEADENSPPRVTGVMRRNSFARKRGESIGTKESKGFIKGVETSVHPEDNDDIFSVHNICIGKINCNDDEEILRKLLGSLKKCFDGVEMMSNNLILRTSGRYFLFENIDIRREFKESTSWSCQLTGNVNESGTFVVPGVVEAQAPCKISSITLRCKPGPKMMRGKAVFELHISFADVLGPCELLEEAAVSAIKDELCFTCAKVLYGFACDAYAPNLPLLRPRLLTSKSTIDVFEEALESQSRGEMEALQACQRQISVLEIETSQSEECATANDTCGQAKNAASNNAFLQLLTLWCKDFYEDDFESDAVFRYEMGKFIEDVFLVCGDAIENEMDPNNFAPFLGLENPHVESSSVDAVAGAPKKIHQNKRESKAIRQSKRLSCKGMIETTPLLRGGMYENLFFFSQQSFFDHNGAISTRAADFSLLSSTPQVMAEQWTLLEHFLFSRVKRSDFLEHEVLPGTNLGQLKQFQWHMMDLCISQIVDSSSIDNAKLKIAFLLDVSTVMESFRNFNGMFEIFTVLQTTSVFRLKDAWAGLKSSTLERSATIKEIFSTTDSFSNYRKYIEKIVDLREKPTVPYLGIYFKDLVHLKQLPTEAGKPGLVNMTKMTSISSKLLDLHTFQQTPYRFTPNFPVISGLFSRPRMSTEEEQYQASIQLVPL